MATRPWASRLSRRQQHRLAWRPDMAWTKLVSMELDDEDKMDLALAATDQQRNRIILGP